MIKIKLFFLEQNKLVFFLDYFLHFMKELNVHMKFLYNSKIMKKLINCLRKTKKKSAKKGTLFLKK